MPPITVMIKPASGICNMRCKYCFYADEQQNREIANYGIMKESVLRAVLTRILEVAEGSCNLSFQGGEPTCAGLDFFQRLIELEQELNVRHVPIHHAIQTNGYLIDDEWADFFARNNFLVGISLDGPKELHNLNRLDCQGNNTYHRVMHTITLLKKHRVPFNILTVVTSVTCRSIRKIYHFFRQQSFDYQQYIPCLDPLGEERGAHPYSLTASAYSKFLRDLFDCWYDDAMHGTLLYNRFFTNLLLILLGRQPEACGMLGVCGKQYVVEADGSVYPCDFYMLDSWRLGNFVIDSVEEIDHARTQLGFIEMSAQANAACKDCQWFALCRGGCRRDREPMIDNTLQKNYFCDAYQEFFSYAFPKLQQIAAKVQLGVLRQAD